MIDLNDDLDSPFVLKVSFNKLLAHYEKLSKSNDDFVAAKAKRILEMQKPHPILREGFSEVKLLETYKKEIRFILQDSFSEILTLNEIKTASVPYHNIIFNTSKRFQNILNAAGKDFELVVENMPEDNRYIIACTVILSLCYGYQININRPFFYKIPDANGILRYYKILYNADFMEIIPTERAVNITQEDVDELLDNFDNVSLWKTKFPPQSYQLNGFVISNIFDVTDDQAISNIKSELIKKERDKDEGFIRSFETIFRSLFNLKDLYVGFSTYNKIDNTFERINIGNAESFILNGRSEENCVDALCEWSYLKLLKEKQNVAISNVDKEYLKYKDEKPHVKAFYNQGFKSVILAPIANEKGLLGVLELASKTPKVLNSIVASKLVDVMPFIVTTVERAEEDEENLIEAIIQKECTSIHPSVHWKFKREAKRFIREQSRGRQVAFNKIAFEEVYPLFGQIDIKGSSEARNWATKEDLSLQLKAAKKIITNGLKLEKLAINEQYLFRIKTLLEKLNTNFESDSEQTINTFFKDKINPFFKHLLHANKLKDEIEHYFESIDNKLQVLYKHRKDYDSTVTLLNKNMASLLDRKQIDAQKIYPHFFERFKTDGVDHNMYIGESITKAESFNPIYLYNLRLWQLQVMCEMENAYYQMQSKFPVALDVASMILVFSQPLTVSFRMDEKQFDVDGTYNARYEVIKKRVDKAFIKGTNNRITEKGKITIVYSQKEDEREYLKYIEFLQFKDYLSDDVEILELEDLQALKGLKAIRVSVIYAPEAIEKELYSYNDLINTI